MNLDTGSEKTTPAFDCRELYSRKGMILYNTVSCDNKNN
jgi:hypothetical protein